MDKEALYNTFYAEASAIIQRINPCEIRTVHGKLTCAAQRTRTELCCDGCKYLSDTGCTTKSLACKLWLCSTVRVSPKGELAAKELDALRKRVWEAQVPTPFRSPFTILD